MKSLPFQSLSCLLFGYFLSFSRCLIVIHVYIIRLSFYMLTTFSVSTWNTKKMPWAMPVATLRSLRCFWMLCISWDNAHQQLMVNIQSVWNEASRVANGTAMESSLRGTRIVLWTKKIWENQSKKRLQQLFFDKPLIVNSCSATAPQSVWFADAKISPSWQKEDKN